MLQDPFIFFSTQCKIKAEDGQIITPRPTEMQVQAGWEAWFNRWSIIIKHRQAKMSTFFVLSMLLPDCMYIDGYQGLLIANKDDTTEQLFERLLYAYDNLPPEFKVPCSTDGKSKSIKYIRFIHGGGVTIMTAGGPSPASGWSPDRVVVSEAGEMPERHQSTLFRSLVPAINKRKHARFVVETTPGAAGSRIWNLWEEDLAGRSFFTGHVFLKWTEDPTCVSEVPTNFCLTSEEEEYKRKHPEMTDGHVMFRRLTMASGFNNRSLEFDSKYPPSEIEGWLSSQNSILDAELIGQKLKLAEPDTKFRVDPELGHYIIRNPVAGKSYLLCADSNKPGKEGDPSAFTIWDKSSGHLVAYFQQREEPDLFAERCIEAAGKYNNAMIAFEANSAEAFVAARMILSHTPGHKPSLYLGQRGSGWYASSKSLPRAHGKLLMMLRDDALVIPAKSILLQLLNYSGDKKKRVAGEDGEMHHFDLARTVAIAADLLALRVLYPSSNPDDNSESEELEALPAPRLGTPVKELDSKFGTGRRAPRLPDSRSSVMAQFGFKPR